MAATEALRVFLQETDDGTKNKMVAQETKQDQLYSSVCDKPHDEQPCSFPSPSALSIYDGFTAALQTSLFPSIAWPTMEEDDNDDDDDDPLNDPHDRDRHNYTRTLKKQQSCLSSSSSYSKGSTNTTQSSSHDDDNDSEGGDNVFDNRKKQRCCGGGADVLAGAARSLKRVKRQSARLCSPRSRSRMMNEGKKAATNSHASSWLYDHIPLLPETEDFRFFQEVGQPASLPLILWCGQSHTTTFALGWCAVLAVVHGLYSLVTDFHGSHVSSSRQSFLLGAVTMDFVTHQWLDSLSMHSLITCMLWRPEWFGSNAWRVATVLLIPTQPIHLSMWFKSNFPVKRTHSRAEKEEEQTSDASQKEEVRATSEPDEEQQHALLSERQLQSIVPWMWAAFGASLLLLYLSKLVSSPSGSHCCFAAAVMALNTSPLYLLTCAYQLHHGDDHFARQQGHSKVV